MKKTLSVVLALAMVLVMSLSAFAAEKPADVADVAAWADYYAEVLADVANDPIDVAADIVADINAGVVDQVVAIDALETAILTSGASDAALRAVEDFLGLEDADALPEILPEDAPLGGIAATIEAILDSLFGFIGDLAAMLFGEDSELFCFVKPTTTEPTTEEILFPEDTTVPEEVPELGDNSILAVGAVALVAGAALVLTRKKDKDAE